MFIKDISGALASIAQLVEKNSLREAFAVLKSSAASLNDKKIQQQLDQLEQRYFFMLRLMLKGNLEVSQNELDSLKHELNVLTTILQREQNSLSNDSVYFSQLRFQALRPDETLQPLFADYLDELKRLNTDTMALTDTKKRAKIETLSSDIFNRIWTDYPFDEETEQILSSFLADDEIPLYDRELWIGAIGFGEWIQHDEKRVSLLADVCRLPEQRLAAVALAWISLTQPVSYPSDLNISPSDVFAVEIEKLKAIGEFRKKDTDFTALIQRMMSLGSDIGSKLGNKDLTPENARELFESAGINMSPDDFEKIKMFQEAQLSGADIYSRSIGTMRNFDFFRNVSNWFLPFYPNHSSLADIVDTEGVQLAELVEKMNTICAGDKFAMLLSLAQAPAHLRRAVIENSASGLASMFDDPMAREMFDQMNIGQSFRYMLMMYFRNLSRFFTSFRRKGDFRNPFDSNGVISAETLLTVAEGLGQESLLEYCKVALSSDLPSATICVTNRLNRSDDLSEESLLLEAKALLATGNAYAAVQPLERILDMHPDYYEVALMLADIYLEDGYYDDSVALSYLEPFISTHSDSIDFFDRLYKAYYMAGDAEKSVEILYQMDYLSSGDNIEIKTMLAQRLLEIGKAEEALAVVDSVGRENTDAAFLIVSGKAHWLVSDMNQAVEIFRKAILTLGEDGFDKFSENILADDNDRMDHGYFIRLSIVPDVMRYIIYGSSYGNLS